MGTMKTTITENIKFKTGQHRYCQCESSACYHGERCCQSLATVVATVECPAYGNQTMQLCKDCLAHYCEA